jgi:hypothetical protein
LRAAAEILDMLESLHEKKQVIGAIGPGDFLIDDAERIACLASDRVIPADQVVHWRSHIPASVYPQEFAAPEVRDPGGQFDARSDLYSWAALASLLITGQPVAGALERESPDGPTRLQAALQTAAEANAVALWAITPQALQSSATDLATGWVRCLTRCLASDPAERPASAEQARQLVERSSVRQRASLWQRLAGKV